jgi:hypothetical protein
MLELLSPTELLSNYRCPGFDLKVNDAIGEYLVSMSHHPAKMSAAGASLNYYCCCCCYYVLVIVGEFSCKE